MDHIGYSFVLHDQCAVLMGYFTQQIVSLLSCVVPNLYDFLTYRTEI